MELTVYRYSSGKDTTLGMLMINGKFAAYTLEDEARTVKVKSETRIPTGRYKVELRKEGGHHARYSTKFPGIHKGMLHVTNVPGFEWILIHIGNTDKDTDGCLLVGDQSTSNLTEIGNIAYSTQAYLRMYNQVIQAFARKEDVWITYHNENFFDK